MVEEPPREWEQQWLDLKVTPTVARLSIEARERQRDRVIWTLLFQVQHFGNIATAYPHLVFVARDMWPNNKPLRKSLGRKPKASRWLPILAPMFQLAVFQRERAKGVRLPPTTAISA